MLCYESCLADGGEKNWPFPFFCPSEDGPFRKPIVLLSTNKSDNQ